MGLLFKKIIIVFWTMWWLLALWTDLVGVLAHLGYIQATWAPDGNYPVLVRSLQMYHVPDWFPVLCFAAIILWLVASTYSFGVASFALAKSKTQWMPLAERAFVISLSFWLAFFLCDQLIMDFNLEENHMVQGGFQLLTYLALHVIPD